MNEFDNIQEVDLLNDPLAKDFRNFLYALWKHINLPDPTQVQYDIANTLQKTYLSTSKGSKRKIIKAFRGVGKSWITSAFTLWILYRDPKKLVLVLSASKEKADSFVAFVKGVLETWEVLEHLRPSKGVLYQASKFNVNGANPAEQNASVTAIGITGQITGKRADVIIADDIEVPGNSMTQEQRDKTVQLVKEFDAILKPDGTTIFLGTDQCEQSLYMTLDKRFGGSYDVSVWTARVPSQEAINTTYKGVLGEHILKLSKELPVGTPTEPKRFDEEELARRELSAGRSYFQLQYMLDTTLSDALKYPLKLSDIICVPDFINTSAIPLNPTMGTKAYSDIGNLGLRGDRLIEANLTGEFQALYHRDITMAIDPAGRGTDELVCTVLTHAHGYLIVLDIFGLNGFADENLEHIAKKAADWKVTHVGVESNMGDGMFTQLLKPVFYKFGVNPSWKDIRQSRSKELRIIEELEPLLNRHRLIIPKPVIEQDYATCLQKYPHEIAQQYMLTYQLTRLTKDKGCLAHDDKIDSLALACQIYRESVAVDSKKHLDEQKERHLNAMIKAHTSKKKNSLIKYLTSSQEILDFGSQQLELKIPAKPIPNKNWSTQ